MNGVVREWVREWVRECVRGQFSKLGAAKLCGGGILGAAKFCGGGMNRNSGMLHTGKHHTCGPTTTVSAFFLSEHSRHIFTVLYQRSARFLDP